jgi:glycosyltransferase involved in cell wall biosynthesis
MGQDGRKRAVAEFGWPAIAAQTADLYAELVRSGLPARPLESAG